MAESERPDARTARRGTVLILQHIACEPAAAYEDELVARGLAARYVRPYDGDELPDWRAFAGMVAMGGPMGTYDEARHPWLAAEKRFIADAVGGGLPFWGVCLGAQLLAAGLGAGVAPGTLPEVGVLPVRLTPSAADDPVFGSAPRAFDALHWHGDTYELPGGAVKLAESERYEQQAFVFEKAYGLQFHLEVTPALVTQWARVPAYAESLERLWGAGAMSKLAAQVAAAERRCTVLARELFGRWLERGVAAGTPARHGGQEPTMLR
jgi:GMP synthase-like glutamine amidotransferase